MNKLWKLIIPSFYLRDSPYRTWWDVVCEIYGADVMDETLNRVAGDLEGIFEKK